MSKHGRVPLPDLVAGVHMRVFVEVIYDNNVPLEALPPCAALGSLVPVWRLKRYVYNTSIILWNLEVHPTLFNMVQVISRET